MRPIAAALVVLVAIAALAPAPPPAEARGRLSAHAHKPKASRPAYRRWKKKRPRHHRRPAFQIKPRPLVVAHGPRPKLADLRVPLGPTPAPVSGAKPTGRPTPAPRRTPDAAGAQALGQALGLPTGALARLAAHGQLLASAPDAAKAVAAAEATRAALFDALAGADPADRPLANDLLRALGQALPGVAVRLPADRDAPPEAGVDYAALARALPDGTPGRPLLALAGILRSPFGPPGYLRQAGAAPCADFGHVTAALAQLPGAWQAAPQALRARLQAPLRDAIVRMGEQADFCPEERRARQAAREAAARLARLPAFGGPGTGKRIGHNFRSYGLRFGLEPAGHQDPVKIR